MLYTIWRRSVPDRSYGGDWCKTSHSLIARSDKEAATKLKRMFQNSGFHSMSLVACPVGTKPK